MYRNRWYARNIILFLLPCILLFFQVCLCTNIRLISAATDNVQSQVENGQRFIFKRPKQKPIRAVLLRFFTAWNPPIVKNIDKMIDKYHGKTATLVNSIKKIYHVKHFDGKPSKLQFNLIQFYMKHAPANIKNVHSILEKYKGKETLLKKKLESYYKG